MKVLKIAAIVIGAAALIATGVGVAAGFSIGTAFAGVAGATAGVLGVSGALVGGVLLGAVGIAVTSALEAVLPKPSATSGTQTKWKPDPYAGNPYLMGRTLAGGNIVLRRGHGTNNMYETFVTILTICTAASIDTTFLNKTTTAFDSGGAAIGTYAGQVWQRQQLGLCPEPSALTSPVGNPAGFTPQHKLSGLAATMLTFKYDTRTTNGLTTEPAPAWIGHWVKVYDPRLDSTYPGGSGACRAYDEDTYVWSENPHLHGLTWAMGRYQNGVRVAGIGAGAPVPGGSVKGVDVPSFVEGANLDDARHWTLGGQVNTRPDTLWNSLKSMLQAGGARPALIGGVITSINRAPRVSLATITRDDIVGKCTFAGTQPRRNRLNGIIPQYRSEAHDWEMVSAGEVSVADFVTLDGDERTKEIAYPLVQDVDQSAQLAAYDLYDLREAGPGSVPLKPWWLNYKVGDCVTFSPEDDLSIKAMITGRAIEAQSGVITYTLRGETDGKHSYALGQSGVAPPIVSLTYATGVDAPAATEWTLTGTALTANGASVPALHVSGGSANSSAEAILFEYRVAGTGDWMAAGVEAAAVTDKVITSITPGTSYEVAVSYRVRGVSGKRLVLGPVTVGDFAVPGTVQAAIANSFSMGVPPVAAADGTVTIFSALRRYPDGHADLAVNGATLSSGLPAGSLARIAYDDFDRAGGAVSYALYSADIDAHSSPEHPGRHYVGYVTIPAAGAPALQGFMAGPQGGDSELRTDLVSYAAGKGAGQIAFTHGVPALPGTLAAKGQRVVCVDDAPFNAKGDGVTDDTAAILAAIDEIASRGGGGVVFTSGKKYLVNSAGLYLEHAYPGIWLIGDAAGTVTIINGSPSRYALTWGRTDMVTYGGGLHGLAFASAEGVLGSGVLIQGVGQFRVESNTFHTYPSKLDIGIKMVGCSQFAFTANEMQGCKTAGANFVNCIDGYIVVGRSDACEGSGYWLNGCQGFYCVSATAYNSGIGWKLQSDYPAIQPNQNNFFINCLGDTSVGYNWLIADSINSYFVSPWGSTQISPTENRGVSGFLITGKHSRHLFFTNPVALFNNGSGMQIYDPGGDAPTDIHISNPVCGSKGISGTPNGNGRGGWGGYGIDINGACDRIRITGGQFLLNASGPINNTSSGTDVIISGNPVGYLTSNQGLASVAVGTSSVLIWHGLGSKPLAGNVGITDLSMRAASGISSTTISDINEFSFTVHTDANVAAQDFQFSWQARAKGT